MNNQLIKPSHHKPTLTDRQKFAVMVLDALEMFTNGDPEDKLMESNVVQGVDLCPDCGEHPASFLLAVGDSVLEIQFNFDEGYEDI
jgi:hypothetical protein